MIPNEILWWHIVLVVLLIVGMSVGVSCLIVEWYFRWQDKREQRSRDRYPLT